VTCTDSDKDLDRSRRSVAEDWRWSSTCRVLSGRTIGRSGDAVYGLYLAQGVRVSCLSLKSKVDEFSGLGLKTGSYGLTI
jgi:hypothetical protein